MTPSGQSASSIEQGLCTSTQGLIEELRIPLHEPKILAGYCRLEQTAYGFCDFEAPSGAVNIESLTTNLVAVPPPEYLDPFVGSRFLPDFAGYAATEPGREPLNQVVEGAGYAGFRDVDNDGRIGEREKRVPEPASGGDLAGERWRLWLLRGRMAVAGLRPLHHARTAAPSLRGGL